MGSINEEKRNVSQRMYAVLVTTNKSINEKIEPLAELFKYRDNVCIKYAEATTEKQKEVLEDLFLHINNEIKKFLIL